MKKITESANQINRISSFTFIGDPGCDGLGVEIMSIFNKAALESDGDFIIVGGDIVPEGTTRLYQNVINMVDSNFTKPVYILCGNHDTNDYEKYFGKKDYYLYDDKLLIVIVDNSKRSFSNETLDLLRLALKTERDTIVLAFHIPPPNKITGNSVSAEEWGKVESIIAPCRSKVKYILCGHIHSYFEDDIDGIKLVATGGGGARIEDVEGIIPPYHHVVEFSFDNAGGLTHRFKPLMLNKGEPMPHAAAKALQDAFASECMAHVRYRLYAEDAAKNKKSNLAKLYLAASDSEFYHARNFFYALSHIKPPQAALVESINNETAEVTHEYVKGEQISQNLGCGLGVYAFNDARAAEIVHMRLFSEAKPAVDAGEDIADSDYFTCTSCGYTLRSINEKTRCAICGAPRDKIEG